MDNILERIRNRMTEVGIKSLANLEKRAGLGDRSLHRWDKTKPSIDKVEKVADVLKVSTDYLLGRTNNPEPYYALDKEEEKDIQKELEKLIEEIENSKDFLDLSDGNSESKKLAEEDKELLLMSLEQSLRIAKRTSKKRFNSGEN